MTEQLTRGMNIYYRGYVVHEDIRHIHYTIYGELPQRREMARAGDSQEAMRWIDSQIADREAADPMAWAPMYPVSPLPPAFAAGGQPGL